MFWLSRKRLSGSYFRLSALSRSYFCRPVGLADALLALLHEEVHVDARVVRARAPTRSRAPTRAPRRSRRLSRSCRLDVERVPGAAPVEGRLVLADPRHRAAELPDREGRQRRLDPQRVLDGDVDDLVGQLGDVAGAEVVPAAVAGRTGRTSPGGRRTASARTGRAPVSRTPSSAARPARPPRPVPRSSRPRRRSACRAAPAGRTASGGALRCMTIVISSSGASAIQSR